MEGWIQVGSDFLDPLARAALKVTRLDSDMSRKGQEQQYAELTATVTME